MKALRGKGWAKALGALLFVICLYACLGSAAGIAYLAHLGAYTSQGEVANPLLESLVRRENQNAFDYYQAVVDARDGTGDSGQVKAYEQRYDPSRTNYFFTVADAQGNCLLRGGQEDWALVTVTETYRLELPSGGEAAEQVWTGSFATEEERDRKLEQLRDTYLVSQAQVGTEIATDGLPRYTLQVTYQNTVAQTITVTGGVRGSLAVDDAYAKAVQWMTRLHSFRYGLIALCVGGGVGTILCLVFLLRAVGHKEGVEGIHLRWMDKIPFDLYVGLLLAIWGCTMVIFGNPYGVVFWVLLGVFAAFWMLLVLALLCTIAVRVKARCLWRNTLIRRLCTLCGRGGRALGRGIAAFFQKLPLFWKAGALFLLCCFLEGMCVLGIAGGSAGGAFFWFLFKVAEAALVIRVVLALRTLQAGGRALAGGDLDYTVPLDHLRWDLKEHGENLNHIRDGIQSAVEERMKSEHLKTELITNVSHDLKTPLTSLINYVDLLKKENLSDGKAAEYLQVLDRQSARLKKLTEDLVEASKASTGNLPVNLEATDGNVLLSQSAGEYEEKLAEKGLQLVLQPALESARILADGRLLWRVFDNLLSNIVKYAQLGTRVYLTSQVREDQVQFIFRNISATPLNLTSQELLERFTRGDASRNTEGSGLGLSIAQSLVALQKGTFRLTIDGDLFKAGVTFARLP